MNRKVLMRKHFPSRPGRGERDDIREENKVPSPVRAPWSTWILAGVQPRLFGRAVQ
eukprot:COSAG02_NODE_97_length_37159_cov_37.660335_37_plen_56_part_00